MACPVRSYMDNPETKWRYGEAPAHDQVNQKYLKEKLQSHKANSLEEIVENIVKTFEMEATHKVDAKDWGSVAGDKFQLTVNGSEPFSPEKLIKIGTYNALLTNCPFYDAQGESFDSSHAQFKSCFPGGFAWELLEVYSGPPKVALKWRHWAHFEGPYHDTSPTDELLELYGSCFATVDDNLKVEKLEMFFDPNPLFFKLTGGKLISKACMNGFSSIQPNDHN